MSEQSQSGPNIINPNLPVQQRNEHSISPIRLDPVPDIIITITVAIAILPGEPEGVVLTSSLCRIARNQHRQSVIVDSVSNLTTHHSLFTPPQSALVRLCVSASASVSASLPGPIMSLFLVPVSHVAASPIPHSLPRCNGGRPRKQIQFHIPGNFTPPGLHPPCLSRFDLYVRELEPGLAIRQADGQTNRQTIQRRQQPEPLQLPLLPSLLPRPGKQID